MESFEGLGKFVVICFDIVDGFVNTRLKDSLPTHFADMYFSLNHFTVPLKTPSTDFLQSCLYANSTKTTWFVIGLSFTGGLSF